jgi:hypothetical protein
VSARKHTNAEINARYLEIRPKYSSDAAADEALRVEFGYKSADGVRGKRLRARRAIEGQSEDHKGGLQEVIPIGHIVKAVSSLVDADGALVMQWIKTNAEQQQWQDIINAVLDRIPHLITPRKPVLRMVSQSNDLLALYPLADLHVGLYASLLDAAHDWRLADTVALVKACIDDLIERTPTAAQAIVAQIGDFTHTDNMLNRTPKSAAPLDADGRYIEIAQAAMEIAVYVIDRVAQHHANVTVIWQSGNHDGASALVIQTALATVYRYDARVHVHQSGKRTHVIQHGGVALGFTHGDTIKAKNLPLIMAVDYPGIWAGTRFRVFHTGHIHHKSVEEYIGCIVESHQSVAPRDAWHENQGYRSLHSLCSIVYNHVGEYTRNVIQIRHSVDTAAAAPPASTSAAAA